MSKVVIGVMGPGDGANTGDLANARELGRLIAKNGWVTLSGGRNSGVMEAVSQGAKECGGLVIGILPTKDRATFSDALDVAVVTDMGSARNNINVLSSTVVVACGMGSGTASEVALALKSEVPVIMLSSGASAEAFFKELGPDQVFCSDTPENAVTIIRTIIEES